MKPLFEGEPFEFFESRLCFSPMIRKALERIAVTSGITGCFYNTLRVYLVRSFSRVLETTKATKMDTFPQTPNQSGGSEEAFCGLPNPAI